MTVTVAGDGPSLNDGTVSVAPHEAHDQTGNDILSKLSKIGGDAAGVGAAVIGGLVACGGGPF